MRFTKSELSDGVRNLNGLLSYIKKVEGTEQFPAIIVDWNFLEEKQKTIVALMAMSMLADYMIKEENENEEP